MAYWQVAAGDEGRDYSDEFLRFGIAFMGTEHKCSDQVQPDDVVVLKSGTTHIKAVGRVVERDGICKGNGDKKWLLDFDGWQLPRYFYVEWHIPPNPIAVTGLRRGTMCGIAQESVISAADRMLRLDPSRSKPEPAEAIKVTDDQILEFLIAEGLRTSAAEDLVSAFRRIRLLATYYYDNCWWSDVREHETRSFLVMPLLLGLGWSEQQLKIELGVSERRRVDVACFSNPYRRDKDGNANVRDCTLIIETKDFRQGLFYAHDQAKDYAKEFPECRVAVVTNGYCYKSYKRQRNGTFSEKPSAYLNLREPMDKYPLDPDNVAGALELLSVLMPKSSSC